MEEPGWLDGAPRSGIGQSCAFCGTRDVTWVHPLARDRLTFHVAGKRSTLRGFWTLCEDCEGVYASGDEDAGVALMRSSDGWPRVDGQDIAERIRGLWQAFRRADRGRRRLDPEPTAVADARRRGFAPLYELTGASDLAAHWPAAHRLWLEELRAVLGTDESLGWLVRSPWPTLSSGTP